MNHHRPAATPATPRSLFLRAHFLRLMMLACCSAILLAGCASRRLTSTKYTELRVSNYRGEILAEYIARGPVTAVEGGYQIHAVERHSGEPFRKLTRYPYGWDTTVVGPRIALWPTTEPHWLAAYSSDGEGWAK